MDKILEKSHDVGVLGVCVYVELGENIAYKDSEHTIPFTSEELKEAFYQGAFLVGSAPDRGGMIGVVKAIAMFENSDGNAVVQGLVWDDENNTTLVISAWGE